jgi:hypothetical protein
MNRIILGLTLLLITGCNGNKKSEDFEPKLIRKKNKFKNELLIKTHNLFMGSWRSTKDKRSILKVTNNQMIFLYEGESDKLIKLYSLEKHDKRPNIVFIIINKKRTYTIESVDKKYLEMTYLSPGRLHNYVRIK